MPYVPGIISDTSEVLVDVGTGYFVNKSTSAAADFLERKVCASSYCTSTVHLIVCPITQVKLLEKNTASLEEVLTQKRKSHEMVVMVMQQKIHMANQAGGGN